MGPEGLEPPLPGLKGRCAAVTPQPLATPTPTPSHSGASQARPAGFEPARQRFWRPPAPPVAPVVCACGGESPVRESNPPPRLERAVSSSARRTGVRFLSLPRREWAVWRIESTSPPFQGGAIPSQLPARKWPRPGACDTGPWSVPDQEEPVPGVSVASNLGDGDRPPGRRNSALAPDQMDLETSRRTWRLTPTSKEN